jgi:hypothetical protein
MGFGLIADGEGRGLALNYFWTFDEDWTEKRAIKGGGRGRRVWKQMKHTHILYKHTATRCKDKDASMSTREQGEKIPTCVQSDCGSGAL